jgi:hypothetical protein
MAETDDIANAWLAAADDLKIEVFAPYILRSDGREYRYIALIKTFGSALGTLVCLPSQWDEGFAEVAEQAGFYCSGVYPESYCRYDRQRFIETLNDWAWFGDPSKGPEWYTGAPWK